MKLKGKVAFITGFGSGLGQAIAVMFAKEGAAVTGTSPTESKGRETVAMVEKLGGKALFWPGDVSNSAQMKTLIDETVRQLGGIDIVVNSGGVRTNGSITDITEEDWDRTLDVNLKGAFIVSRLAIPEMKKRGGGVILHIAARSGMLGQSGRAAYCASKGGMVRLTEAMAMDHAKDKIRVNCICPGPTRTPMVDTSTPEAARAFAHRPFEAVEEPFEVLRRTDIGRLLGQTIHPLVGGPQCARRVAAAIVVAERLFRPAGRATPDELRQFLLAVLWALLFVSHRAPPGGSPAFA